MSSTNKTTNYELSQFIETDRPAWLTDYNGDMRTIDSTMKAISDVASGASGSISELADRMSTAEGNITTNANDIDALEARADSLEAQAQSTAGTIANIQTEQAAQNLGIEAATELGYNLARPYDSASTYAVGDYVLFQNTLYKCITAVSTGEAFDPTKWLAIKATDEIASGGFTVPITPLDNTNFVISNISVVGQDYSRGSQAQTTLANPDVKLVENGGSFIAKIGNLVIAHLFLIFTCDSMTLTAGHRIVARTTCNFPNIFYTPSKTVFACNVRKSNSISDGAYVTIHTDLSTTINFNTEDMQGGAVNQSIRVPIDIIYTTA